MCMGRLAARCLPNRGWIGALWRWGGDDDDCEGTLVLALLDTAICPIVLGRLALPGLLAQPIAPHAMALVLQDRGPVSTLALRTVLALGNLILIATLRVTLAKTVVAHPV